MVLSPEVPFNDLPDLPPVAEVETKTFLKAVTAARVAAAELDRASRAMPDPSVLINTISLLEAQASSEIENIVTTTDALFRFEQVDDDSADAAVKETLRYRSALRSGFEAMTSRALTVATAVEGCSRIRDVDIGVRNLPGMRIANPATGRVIYSPPEGQHVIAAKLGAWESFLHSSPELDPIVRMALAHYQFEAIHPFTDGNGRTGRILNILLLVESGVLRAPILYLSPYIIDHKDDYYRLLADVTQAGAWEPWVLYMVEAVRSSARSALATIDATMDLQEQFAEQVAGLTPGIRHAGFLSVLFAQPYTRIGDLMDRCAVSRPTATGWLNDLLAAGMVTDVKQIALKCAAAVLVPAESRAWLADRPAARLGTGSREVRLSLSQALCALAEDTLPAIGRAVTSDNDEVRLHALTTQRIHDDPDLAFDTALEQATRVRTLQGAPLIALT
ncbi:MAG: hypothetical protein QG671_219 [Actinomycetota bacterium]|nr:hypothetical protein [Actinomycetota bacterium]